jgi:UDP-3-O-[3-hydroxymyristoyl] glucosamine N-acyltransferase
LALEDGSRPPGFALNSDAMVIYTLGELARLLGAELVGDPAVEVSGVAELAEARAGFVAPFTDPSRLEEARASAASALIARRAVEGAQAAFLLCDDPSRGLGLVLDAFAEGVETDPGIVLPELDEGVDPRASVHGTATVAEGAWVGPFAFVGRGALVGRGSRILPFAYVGDHARVGQGCRLDPGAVLLEGCAIGDGAVLGPHAVVGGSGFGFYRDRAKGWRRIRGAGSVELGAGVELGSHTCVDRATLGATRIGAGTKVDNLVQVGHNSLVGERVLLCAQVGLSGSVRIGDDTILAGQVGVADHRRIGRSARVGAKSGVAHDVPDGGRASGIPAIPQKEWLRASAVFARLGELARKVERLGRDVGAILGQKG